MGVFPWFLIGWSVSDTLNGTTYRSRQSISSASTVRNCVFDGCSGPSNGGGLHFDQQYATITVTDTTFTSCHSTVGASWGGGAFYISVCTAATMNRTSGTNCTSATTTNPAASNCKGGLGLISVESGSGPFRVAEMSMALCDCGLEQLALDCPGYTIGPSAVFTDLNATACHAACFASTAMFYQHNNLSAQFMTVAGNTGGNILAFRAIAGGHTVRCLAMVNNTCVSVPPVNGMLRIRQAMTIADSIFQGNTADWFVGVAEQEASTTVTFVGCVFDQAAAGGSSHSVVIATSNCVSVEQPTRLATCAGTEGTSACTSTRQTASPSDEFTDAWEMGMRPGLVIRMACFLMWVDA